jgi:hypothetical protein
MLERLAGKNVCISYATTRPSNVYWARKHAQSIMFDNGAFSAFVSGLPFDYRGFYEWIEPHLGHPNWAVIPDVIDGSVDEQRALRATWPYDKSIGAPVWHLAAPLEYLLELVDEYPRVCFGSSGEYWKISKNGKWARRMDEAFDFLASKRTSLPWVHGLRMLSQLGNRWPLASADSVNVSRNYTRVPECPGCMSHRIDMVNGPVKWAHILSLDFGVESVE